MFIFLLICLVSTSNAATSSSGNFTETHCGENGDCVSENIDCNTLITSDNNNSLPVECFTNIKELLKTLTTKYNSHDKIHLEVQRVFQGVIISMILFGACASVCVFAACIYCCRINYVDYRLKKDVEALAAKLKRDCKVKKPRMKTPPEPVSESCNIVVESAGVYVV